MRENTAKHSSWQKYASIEDGRPRKRRACAGGHVTGYFAGGGGGGGGGGGSREELERARQTQCFLGLSI